MFIFRKEKSIPDDLCDAFIETFETCPESYRHRGVVSNKKDGVYQVKDTMNKRFVNRIDILESPGTKPYKVDSATIMKTNLVLNNAN